MAAIGIDLGTTYSCVAVYQHGKVEVILNEVGNRLTPSMVAFTGTERLIGDAAKWQAASNPANTVFDAKRLIGQQFEDAFVQANLKHWPFKVVKEGEGQRPGLLPRLPLLSGGSKPLIEVEYRGERKRFAPEQVSSMVLGKLKENAEAYLGTAVTKAVISVPAYFNNAQRQATKDAGAIAGLEVLRIISEPTVAAIAYGLNVKAEGQQHQQKQVLIFDLGGGTFDVSVLTITGGGVIEVKSTSGDTQLGGEDFDSRLVEHCVQEFKRMHPWSLQDPSDNKRAMRRLRTACEQAKRALSTASTTTVEVDAFFEGLDFIAQITRARFEQLCADLFASTLEPVGKALADAKLDKSQIDEVILVGGSTRIPKVQKLLQDFFNGKQLNQSINPDEAVAYGAAVQAAILGGSGEALALELRDILLRDVTPLSLGVNVKGELMATVIPRNTPIPARKTQNFATDADDQVSAEFKILEGERAQTKDNDFLGVFTLDGIPPAPRNEGILEVTFDLDANGILKVTAQAQSNNNKRQSITINHDRDRRSKEEIERMVEEAKRFKEEDDRQRARVKAFNDFEDYAYEVKKALKKEGEGKVMDFTTLTERNEALKAVAQAFKWLRRNSLAKKEEIEHKKDELEECCKSILVKLGSKRW